MEAPQAALLTSEVDPVVEAAQVDSIAPTADTIVEATPVAAVENTIDEATPVAAFDNKSEEAAPAAALETTTEEEPSAILLPKPKPQCGICEEATGVYKCPRCKFP